MNTAVKSALLATMIAAVAAPAFADLRQLAGSAGLTAQEAEGLSLREIAQIKAANNNDD